MVGGFIIFYEHNTCPGRLILLGQSIFLRTSHSPRRIYPSIRGICVTIPLLCENPFNLRVSASQKKSVLIRAQSVKSVELFQNLSAKIRLICVYLRANNQLPFPSFAEGVKEDNSGGNGDIERLDFAEHRDGDKEIAIFFYETTKTFFFIS